MHTWNATTGTDDWVDEAVAELRAGGVVGVPTDTYYGLAADSRSAAGIETVLALKGRPPSHPLLLLTDSVASARRLSPAADPRLEQLAAAFWPGALTLIVPAIDGLHPALVGPTGGVAVRVPAHEVPRRLSRLLGAAVTGTSANRTGREAVRVAADIDLATDRLAGVIDAGRTAGGPASTLLDLTSDPPAVLRKGACDEGSIRKVLGERLL
jgi:L-threonylcarbamoyladenylate synthase